MRRITIPRTWAAACLALAVTAGPLLAAACGNSEGSEGSEGSGGGGEAGGGAAAGGGHGGAAACEPAVDRALQAWEGAGFSGSIALTTRGASRCLAAYGLADRDAGRPNTVDSVFSIGSVSKAFTAAAVLDLVDQGRVALDDRAGELVADLTGPVREVTVQQLLLHTSGLTGSHGQDHQPLDRDDAVAALGRLELAFAPGSDFLYSNAGYTLLALIVEEAAGRPYREHLVERVLRRPGRDGGVAGGFWDGQPAAPGPRAVGYLDGDEPTDQMGDFGGPHWALAGNGDLAMTMGDLAAWVRALFSGDLLSPASTAAVATPGFDQGDGTGESPGWVTYDAAAFGEPALVAAGGGGDVGHDVVVAWLPGSERVVALASNTAEVTAGELLRAIAPALVAGDPLPRPEGPTSGDPGDSGRDGAGLDALAGTYELAGPAGAGGGSFEVSVRDGRLEVAARGAGAVAALLPPSGGFTAEDVRAHEEAVQALLQGETTAGREERAMLEDDLGPLDGIELAGTVVRDGELRTYVTVTSGSASHDLWYALDGQGAVAAAEVAAEPPSLTLAPVTDGDDGPDGDGGQGDRRTFRPVDPTGAGPDVTVTFAGDRMTVTGPGGTAEARVAS